MKKLLLAIMFVTITMWMPINLLADADTTITQDTKEKTGEISIDYSIEETYTVIIPASVTFTDTNKTVERGLQVSNVMINEGRTLYVNVASLNNFTMKNGKGYIDYNLMVNYNTTPKENSYNILMVDAGEVSGWAILTFVTELKKDHALYAGNYTDTLTFTVSVE